jgi:hypothetical protein
MCIAAEVSIKNVLQHIMSEFLSGEGRNFFLQFLACFLKLKLKKIDLNASFKICYHPLILFEV